MYEGTNSKALQSQKWLADALVTLLHERPYAKITIQDICRQADLSRQTFYNVFDSKEEILHYYLQGACEEQLRLFSQKDELTVQGIVDSFVHVLTENHTVLNEMIANGLGGIISEEIANVIRQMTGRFVRQDQVDALFPYSEAMLAGALSGLLLYWAGQEEPIGTEQLTALLSDFLNGELYKFPAV